VGVVCCGWCVFGGGFYLFYICLVLIL
jgi:hypothetical protein